MWAVLTVLAALAVLAAGLWFMPASLLPGDVRVCTVTGGGTMRVETRQCGTLLVRGHADVQRGKDYAFHLALNNILSNAEYNIPEAIVLCNDNVRIDGKVVYLPIYMAMFLQRKRESIAGGEYIPDISALLA